ncbi:hypothetical protein B4N84_27720 [Flavobacterium sp. IR1]|nr:hypothetical protein B4N84_27720 [Flavobacterium sp. IR1]
MPNFTFEDYKNAIRAKFEIEKKRDPNQLLASPSQANLRNWCWEVFSSNTSIDDLRTFRSFFEFEFDLEKINHFREQTDRFRPVGSFLRGETDPINRFLVELAAILVDFQPRPYRKYQEKGLGIPETTEPPIKPPVKTPVESPPTIIIVGGSGQNPPKPPKSTSNFIADFFQRFNKTFSKNFTRKFQKTLLAIILIFGLIATVIYFAFFKMHCMQWSEDHYEIVDCTPETTARTNLNPIIPLDDRLLDFRKVAVCDTTTCFKPDGQAVVWYAKNKNRADFFNSNGIGRHPETERALRPVTEYIKGKYKTPCDLKHK